jgi:hypothetical protein
MSDFERPNSNDLIGCCNGYFRYPASPPKELNLKEEYRPLNPARTCYSQRRGGVEYEA